MIGKNDIIIDSINGVCKINGDDIKRHEFLQINFQNGEWSYIISNKNPFISSVIEQDDN